MSGAQTFEMTLLTAAAAYRTAPTAEAWEALLLALQRQPSVERFLHGARAVPTALAVSADGACAAALVDDRVLVWDLQTGRTRAEIQDSERRPSNHAFGSECNTLVAGFEDGAVQTWSLGSSPARLWSVSGSGKAVTAIAVSNRVVAVGYDGGRLLLLAGDSGAVVAEVPAGHPLRVSVLKFNSDGTVLASVDWSGAVRRWSAAGLVPDGEPAACLSSSGAGILALSDDLTRCASAASPPGPATVTNLDGRANIVAEVGGQWILALDFSADGRSLITANQGGELEFWDLAAAARAGGQAKPTAVWSEHRADVTAVVHSPKDNVFVSAARDQSVVVWGFSAADRLVSERVRMIPDFETAVLDSSLREAIAANTKGDLFRRNLDEPASPVSIGGFGRPVSALAIREQEREVVGGAPNGEVVVRGMDSGEQRVFAAGQTGRIEKLRLDTTGLRLAAVAENGTASLWELADGRLIATFPEATSRTGRGGGVTAAVDIAFEPGGDRLVSIHGNNQAFLWHWINSRLRFDPFLLKPTSYFTSVAFSPDRQTVALGTGIYEGGIALFDSLNSNPAAAILTGHDLLDVTALAFSPDGRLLLSGGFDRRINLWDVAGRRRIGEAYRAPGAVETVTFAKSGLAAAALTDQGTIVRWDLDPVHWIAAACRIANRDWTPEERLRLLGSADGESACPAPE
jgi:WD40 repeat protein